MKTSDFFYELSPELIAQHPAPERTQARLMTLNRQTHAIDHWRVSDLPAILRSDDLLVLNNTRVFPARLTGVKAGSGGRVEILLLEESVPDEWVVLWKASRPLRPGTMLVLAGGELQAEILQPPIKDTVRLKLFYTGKLMDILERHGQTPLPPYIRRTSTSDDQSLAGEDRCRYQTVYATVPGAVAAPTAGLHFTRELLAQLKSRGIATAEITLHVGPGTFRPVTTENIEDHRMDSERFSISPVAAAAINAARAGGRRVVAVGSTVMRTLETAPDGKISPGIARSNLFIRPPHRFKMVDAMLTNFHLPASTLLMMVSAFAGIEFIRHAYAEAVRERYRFYSYGDCMLIE